MMVSWIWIIVALMVGASFGLVAAAMCSAAANGDRMMGKKDDTYWG